MGLGINDRTTDFREGCASSNDVNKGSSDSDGRLAKKMMKEKEMQTS